MISAGGWSDFVDSFDTIDDARSRSEALPYDIVQIIDLMTGEDVFFTEAV